MPDRSLTKVMYCGSVLVVLYHQRKDRRMIVSKTIYAVSTQDKSGVELLQRINTTHVSHVYHDGTPQSVDCARQAVLLLGSSTHCLSFPGLLDEDVYEDYFSNRELYLKETRNVKNMTVSDAIAQSHVLATARPVITQALLGVADRLPVAGSAIIFAKPYYMELATPRSNQEVLVGLEGMLGVEYHVMWNKVFAAKRIIA